MTAIMAELKKDLRLYGLIMVAIGSCIGSGIFLTPSQIAGHLPAPLLILLAWGLGTSQVSHPHLCHSGSINLGRCSSALLGNF